MSYLRRLASVTWVNRNAFLSGSSMPPRNCQRTRGCISVSLSIGRSTVTSSPARSRATRCSWRSGWSRLGAASRRFGSAVELILDSFAMVGRLQRSISTRRREHRHAEPLRQRLELVVDGARNRNAVAAATPECAAAALARHENFPRLRIDGQGFHSFHQTVDFAPEPPGYAELLQVVRQDVAVIA